MLRLSIEFVAFKPHNSFGKNSVPICQNWFLFVLFNSRTPFKQTPSVEGQQIDLYLLYWLVTAQGGFEKVSCPHECYLQLRPSKVGGRCDDDVRRLLLLLVRLLSCWRHKMRQSNPRASGVRPTVEVSRSRWSGGGSSSSTSTSSKLCNT